MHTGDLGIIDQEGNIFIKGRSKTMILGPSGKNIFPDEIEAVINNMDYITESLVISEDNKLIGLIYPDYEKVKNDNIPEDRLLAILEEIGPADDLRICEALNQKEAKTIKPKYLKHLWPINEVTPRRGELVGMRLVEDMGKFQHPDRRCPIHLWRVCGDKRGPAGYWIRIIQNREPVILPVPVKNNRFEMSATTAGRILRGCRRQR
jgi:acyl-CoA synthetase (AMP-forming)/AMP-acid ligase II